MQAPPDGSIPPTPIPRRRRWVGRLLLALLFLSLVGNLVAYSVYQSCLAPASVTETFKSGSQFATDKIAIISISGTISPPFTSRTLRSIEQAGKDEQVKGVLLTIDSPGGLVADSHQIYHKLQELRTKKPVYVAMKSFCASGGLYIAMGGGEESVIFAEPTTWTGSIGVIIPRYEVAKLAKDWGVEFAPLKTGPMKDSLSPFRELRPDEVEVWKDLLNQSFVRFLKVIDDNRKTLTYDQVKALATGRIYSADDALKNGLIDQIGYEEDALRILQEKLGLTKVKVVSYSQPDSLLGILLSQSQEPRGMDPLRTLLESAVPRQMYYAAGLLPESAISP